MLTTVAFFLNVAEAVLFFTDIQMINEEKIKKLLCTYSVSLSTFISV